MNNRIYIFTLLIFPVFLLGLKTADNDYEPRRNEVLLDVIIQSLTRNHFQQIEIDDNFSEEIFNTYLERIDYSKHILLQEDVDKLSDHKTKLDDYILQKNYDFFEISEEILVERQNNVESFYEEILSQPFDFQKEEEIELDYDKIPYAQNLDELREIWRKSLKYRVLTRLADKLDTQEKAIEKNDTSVTIKDFETLEKEAREKVQKTYKDYFHRMDKIDISDRRNTYLNAFAMSFDPHTVFLPPRDKENFDISMSGQFEGIGATLSEREGYIKVVNIVPGSASWKQGELEEGDIILKVAQGEDEPVDVVDMRLDKAVKMIRGKKGTEVRLTVKKIDGSQKVIPIIRDVVVLEETYAKSAILDDSKEKIGYIKLPKFYADFTQSGSPNCSDDIEKEVRKLKAENIDGLILDLRNNGGGSLRDVVDIAGLFIDKGPVVQVKGRQPRPYIFEDRTSGVLYDGPFVILVNSKSASASEILAAAMQDYERAVIVGGNSTFGKGTVQKLINFDQVLPKSLTDLKPLGAIKMTIQKFYRIDGGATQLKGVIPDVSLPDAYKYIKYGEKELDNPMPWTQIEPLEYSTYSKPVDIEKIKRKSLKRQNKNDLFVMADKNAKRLKEQRDITHQTLNIDKFREIRKERNTVSKEYREAMKQPTGLDASLMPVDTIGLAIDTAKQESTKRFLKNLKKDAYLFEAVQIVKDI